MFQPPKIEKHDKFGVTAQFAIEVQPLRICNSFQQFLLMCNLTTTMRAFEN
jgi:hypothetical protein